MQESVPHKTLVVVSGPTASGKTRLAIRLARTLGGPVLSADARQVYKGLEIGSCKATAEERAQAPHELLDLVSPDEPYSAADYMRDALALLDKLFAGQKAAVMAGGAGFYVKAVAEGLDDLPPTPPEIRAEVARDLETNGLPSLLAELETGDPATFAKIDRQNPARVCRALETLRASGKPLSHFQKGEPAKRNFRLLSLTLNPPREQLYARINARVHEMLAAGLLDEVRGLLAAGYAPEAPGLRTIGYQEPVAFLNGEISEAEMIAAIQQNTRRYAKRQLTWLRNQRYQTRPPNEQYWFGGPDDPRIPPLIEEKLC